MKKINLILIALIIMCMICFSSCDEKPAEEVSYTVTEEQWFEILKREIPADNVTITTSIDGGYEKVVVTTKLDLKNNTISFCETYEDKLQREMIVHVENGIAYGYMRDFSLPNSQWTRETSTVDMSTLRDKFMDMVGGTYCYQYVNVASGNYADFKYDPDTQDYHSDHFVGYMAWKGGIYGEGKCQIKNATYKYANGELIYMQYERDIGMDTNDKFVTECKDYGTTVIALPTQYIEK